MAAEQPSLFSSEPEPEPLSGVLAEVVFNKPLDHAYSYLVPAELRDAVAIGKRVLTPFGKGDRAAVGFCVGLNDVASLPENPTARFKVLRRVLDEESLLTPDLMRLTRWMADYYLCGWGQVLNAVVPAGAKQQAGTRAVTFLEAVPSAPEPPTPLPAKQAAALEQLRASPQPLTAKKLAELARCGAGPIDALVEKGLARRVTRRLDTFAGLAEAGPLPDRPIELNTDQLKVWAPVELAVRQGGFKAFLLHGVTGSGKTEIYLRAIEEIIRLGKEAIVLVPEISLTPQTIERFRGRCGEVAVLHSHLRSAERGGHWRRVASGQVQVVVGARSAVFAPTRKLGLIVIDEEHEGSFKQESTPRYHARDVAVMRARLEGIPIILGSATPSLESWHNTERGQYTRLTLPNRVLDLPLPAVTLIDLRHEPPQRGRFRALSQSLERAMRHALQAGGQVMLLLNRRGYSTSIFCPACGSVEKCKFCDLALTFHREREVALCHYCGYEKPPLERCQQCGLAQVRYLGLGTEKLQEEIEQKFSGYVVRRMDTDTMRRPGSHERTLKAFREGLIHILLGTQMIAKGLDFPNVTLVGVVNADMGLHIPDFRSAERTFQLLAQVSGRTGRGTRGGRVLIQTFNPEQPCIALAARHDYLGFVKAELPHRQAHHYPPYHRMARLILRGRNQEKVADYAERLAADFQAAMNRLTPATAQSGEVRLLGPAEAAVFRLKGYYRYHFQLQSPSAATLHQLLRAVIPAMKLPSDIEHMLDVDPFNML